MLVAITLVAAPSFSSGSPAPFSTAQGTSAVAVPKRHPRYCGEELTDILNKVCLYFYSLFSVQRNSNGIILHIKNVNFSLNKKTL